MNFVRNLVRTGCKRDISNRMKISFFLMIFLMVTEISTGEDVFLYDSHGRRDPFVPLAGPGVRYISSGLEGMDEKARQSGGDEFVLSGIVWDPQGGCFAVINGMIGRENDKIENCPITAIKKNMVILLDKEGKEKILTLYIDNEQSEPNLREGEEDVRDKE